MVSGYSGNYVGDGRCGSILSIPQSTTTLARTSVQSSELKAEQRREVGPPSGQAGPQSLEALRVRTESMYYVYCSCSEILGSEMFGVLKSQHYLRERKIYFQRREWGTSLFQITGTQCRHSSGGEKVYLHPFWGLPLITLPSESG